MAVATILLLDAFKTRSLGSGALARIISGAPKKPRLGDFGDRAAAEEKGAENGREDKELLAILRFESAGSENIFAGRDVRALCDRSSVVSAVRSAN
jgi:hypothetical protein